MLRSIFILFVIFCFSVSTYAQDNTRISGEILVQLKYKTSIQTFEKELQLKNIIYSDIAIISDRLNIWLITFNETISNAQEILQTINSIKQVEIVQFNHTLQQRNNIPDDDSFPLQWNMLNDGSGGTDDADIDADEAWDITTGGVTLQGDSIVIAIVDEGFDLLHQDIYFQKNYFETQGNTIDDDGNGFADDYYGWNASTHNDAITSSTHGTHVSGIAGAIGDNGVGVAGVNWHVSILPVMTDVVESQVIEAYTYVLSLRELYDATDGDKGYFVVATNSSFGIDLVSPDDYPLWCAMYDTLGKAGILSSAATTNGNYNVDIVGDMPTACASDYLITVTNTNKFDQLLSGGFGLTSIDIGAPGTSIYSTIAGNSYGTQTGTSMSAPHIAGAVALMLSNACTDFLDDYKNDPDSTILFIKQYILESVDELEDLEGVTVSGGRLNLYSALLKLAENYCNDAIVNIPHNLIDVTIFPNPATDKIFISINDMNYKQKLKAEILNILGDKIISTNYVSPEILKHEGLNIIGNPAGTYLLSLYDENNIRVFSSGISLQ